MSTQPPRPTTDSDPSGEPVAYVVADGVGTIRLARPEAMNSLDLATKEALLDVVGRAAADPAVRCVVLTGTGRAFCVGQDLKEYLGALRSGDEAMLHSTIERHYNPIVRTLLTMPKPVVAAVNGVAAGAGASLAFACDFRLLAESAGFNMAFSGIGLSCDTGSSWTLPRLVGRERALELLYLSETVPSSRALELGLATRVVPDADLAAETTAFAARLAGGPTLAYGAIRDAVTYSSTHALDEALAHEGAAMALTSATEDHRQALTAFVEKQPVSFLGR